MKTDLNNIVVEVLDLDHGKEVIKTLNELGINTLGNTGDCIKDYYGLINGRYGVYAKKRIRESRPKIITLDELKSMKPKEDVYPKLMYVGTIESHLDLKHEKEVFYNDGNGFWAYDNDNKCKATFWKYAQDIEPEAPIEKEVIDINIPNLENVIVKINGKEINY